MWQQNISKLMYSSGWGSGLRLPIANAENLELERELEKRHRLIQIKLAELEDIENHNEILEKALRNTSDHIAHDAKLTNAKTSEIAADKELLKMAEKDVSDLTRECKYAQDAFNKAVKKNRDLMNEIETRKRDLADLTDLIAYDRKELAIIERQAADESHVLAAIEEICDQDADALKKCETRYRKATEDTGKLRLELDGKISLTRVMQAELDGIGDRFRKLHQERGEIVEMWRDTMTSLSQRDEEMTDIAQEYQEQNSLLKSATEKVKEERRKLQTQEQAGSTALMQLNKWDRKVTDIREEIKTVSECRQDLKDNILTFEIAISLTSTHTQDLNSKSSRIETELSEINARVVAASAQIADLKVKVEGSSLSALSVVDRLAHIQELVDEEAKRLDCLRKSLEREMHKKGQWLNQKGVLVEKHTSTELQIRGAKAGLHRSIVQGREAKMTLERRKAAIYSQELLLISIQLRCKPLVNQRLAENRPGYKEQGRHIMELKMEVDEITKRKSFVINQVNHIVQINKKMYRENKNLEEEMVRLEIKNNEHRVEVRCSVKNLDMMVGEYQNAIVDNSLIKLKLRQLAKMLKEEKDVLNSTGSQRVMLQTAIKEKRSEIDAHSRILEMRKRTVKDELSQMRVQLGLVSACIIKRRDRYELTMKLMSTAEEAAADVDNVESEAYHILKMVQEREILTQEGDNWDRKVKEAEIETEALQNSLSLIKCSNDMFKDSLKPVADDECLAEVNRLKQVEKECLFRKNKATNTLRKLKQDIPIKIEAIELSQHQTSNESNKAMDKEYDLRVLTGELNNQATSGKRVRMLTNKLLRGLTFSSPQEKEFVSQDIKLKATRRKFEFAVQALAKLLNLHPFLYDMIGKSLSKQFGEETAIKFLNQVSPWIGEASSPTGSQIGVGKASRKSSMVSVVSRGVSMMDKRSMKSAKSVESVNVKFSTASTATAATFAHKGSAASSRSVRSVSSKRSTQQSTISTFGGAKIVKSTVDTKPKCRPPVVKPCKPLPADYEEADGINYSGRTESETEVLHNVAISVESNRRHAVEEKKRKKELLQKKIELLQQEQLAREQSAMDVQQSDEKAEESPLMEPKSSSSSSSEDEEKLASSGPGPDTAEVPEVAATLGEDKEVAGAPDMEKTPEKLGSISESPELVEDDDDSD